jgi:hypothetical protein
MELGNVLSAWAYMLSPPEKERHRLMWARRRARSLLVWVFDHYRLLDQNSQNVDPMKAFCWQYLVQLARTIVFYKQEAEKRRFHNRNEHVTFQAVKKLVLSAVKRPQALNDLYLNSKIPNTNMVWNRQFTVQRITDPRRRKSLALYELCSSN